MIVHVKQKANSTTHDLAQEAATHNIDKFWLEEIPLSIYAIVIREYSVSI
jgi:hypothetical protein